MGALRISPLCIIALIHLSAAQSPYTGVCPPANPGDQNVPGYVRNDKVCFGTTTNATVAAASIMECMGCCPLDLINQPDAIANKDKICGAIMNMFGCVAGRSAGCMGLSTNFSGNAGVACPTNPTQLCALNIEAETTMRDGCTKLARDIGIDCSLNKYLVSVDEQNKDSSSSGPSPIGLGDSGITSNSHTSGFNGSFASSGTMRVWQWIILICFLCCFCSFAAIAAGLALGSAAGASKKKKPARQAPVEPPMGEPEPMPIVEERELAMPEIEPMPAVVPVVETEPMPEPLLFGPQTPLIAPMTTSYASAPQATSMYGPVTTSMYAPGYPTTSMYTPGYSTGYGGFR